MHAGFDHWSKTTTYIEVLVLQTSPTDFCFVFWKMGTNPNQL